MSFAITDVVPDSTVVSNKAGGSSERRSRVLYFDLLNIGATICVIYLHCNGMVHTFSPGYNWVLALAIECLFYWAVPVFFMLTGATLIGYRRRYSTTDYFKRRVARVVIPFFAWSLIWYLLIPGVNGGVYSVGDWLTKTLNNQVCDIYWFFFPLFGIYLSMPLLSLLDDRYRLQLYLVAGTFILESLLPFVLPAVGVSAGAVVTVSSAASYVMFVLLGPLLSQYDIKPKTRLAVYALGLLGLVFRFAYTLLSSESIGNVDRLYFNYIAFPSVLLSVAVFVWFKYRDWTFLSRWGVKIASIAACSFGVYLVHYPILHRIVFARLGVSPNSILFRTVGALLFYVVVVLGVYVAKRIPVVRKLFP